MVSKIPYFVKKERFTESEDPISISQSSYSEIAKDAMLNKMSNLKFLDCKEETKGEDSDSFELFSESDICDLPKDQGKNVMKKNLQKPQ